MKVVKVIDFKEGVTYNVIDGTKTDCKIKFLNGAMIFTPVRPESVLMTELQIEPDTTYTYDNIDINSVADVNSYLKALLG